MKGKEFQLKTKKKKKKKIKYALSFKAPGSSTPYSKILFLTFAEGR